MGKVIAITGPTGSGKSSVSLALAKTIEKCVFIEIDHIKHMIISGFYKNKEPDGEEAWRYSEWRLVGEAIALMSKNFADHGFAVVIGGYMHTEGWGELSSNLKINHKFMLYPAKETIKIRDVERDEKYYMGEETIDEHIDYLSSPAFDDFIRIDSTEQNVEETVEQIIELVNRNN